MAARDVRRENQLVGKDINNLVAAKYQSAKSLGSLLFSPTEVTTITSSGGLPFQLRYCPALSRKPKSDSKSEPEPKSKPDNHQKAEPEHNLKQKTDPFESPASDLLITVLPDDSHPTHNLILNKYPVIPGHCIISTIDFKSQTDLLENLDLAIAHDCLRAWETNSSDGQPHRLFAFFNSGQHSGASQPHRHLQLLPVEEMVDSCGPKTWRPLIDIMKDSLPEHENIGHVASLPFQHFATTIPKNPTAEELGDIYRKLLDSAQQAMSLWLTEQASDTSCHEESGTDVSISYNLAMTADTMAICPRRREVATFPTDNGEGSVALNGTLLGGTLMVKERSEWNALRRHQYIDDVLKQIGIPASAQQMRPLETRL